LEPILVWLADSALSDLDKIPDFTRRQILTDIKSFFLAPSFASSHKEARRGYKPPIFRLRSGDCRFLYRFQEQVVAIMRIIVRKDLERIIRRLR
jgi:mRNA-degrading endonuclease RelE of RelBE toxin-antitoxin system